ncbi:VOC family protein [Bacillus sp. 2205SS5-2]|uniref:VOC family protein n=1 Tax=Bacillus sp. 2205SS5-2 TaxID=3109031 RepID=UPI00300690D0
MVSPIINKIGAVFIPVRSINNARDWYCDLLGLSADSEEIIAGHLFVIPLEDKNSLVLDSKIFSPSQTKDIPLFHFNTDNIYKAYEFMKEKEITLISDIEHDQWFTIQDPDGNILMVCQT